MSKTTVKLRDPAETMIISVNCEGQSFDSVANLIHFIANQCDEGCSVYLFRGTIHVASNNGYSRALHSNKRLICVYKFDSPLDYIQFDLVDFIK
jgi:hypothetical protein